ncbi:methylase [Glycocaulis albus]|uniref:Methylase n=2 Tax=Glycocaulis albus TaxID=1382801 RepID=A0ABQ1XWF5_9PROT|nr:methylase [Glycocaulis albus]
MHQQSSLTRAATLFAGTPIERPLSRASINDIMDATHESGRWEWRDAYDAIEAATVLRILASNPASSVAELLSIATRLQHWKPTQTIRSIASQSRELFSTPPILAAAATALLTARSDMRVIEPSAGNGMLAAFAGLKGAALTLNEPNAQSRSILKFLFPTAEIMAADAAVLDALTAPDGRYHRAIINPPFAHAERHLKTLISCLGNEGIAVALLPARLTDARALSAVLGDRAECDVVMSLAPKLFAHAGVSTATALVRLTKRAPRKLPDIQPIADYDAMKSAILDILRASNAQPGAAPSSTPVSGQLGLDLGQGSANRPSRVRSFGTFRPPLPGKPLHYGTTEPQSAQPAGDSAIFARYRPSRVALEDAKPHITPLVETFSMASVPAPKPTYQPCLPARVIKSGILTDAQLESIIYAGQAHERFIPGAYLPNESALDVNEHPEGHAYRYGYFIADGTGVGKGREIAGILMDNLCRGRTRHLWISESATLIEDARRDWTALGGRAHEIIDLKAISANDDISNVEGILFATYATLRMGSTQARRARIDQIIEAFGADFDGLIIFDEAHAMGSAIQIQGKIGMGKASQTGLTGLRLQNMLPEARIVYVSATGGSHVENLAYATRLGLWGCSKTPFDTREACLSNLSAGGPAALELLMRELKGRGLYTARSLSYEGVSYDPLTHDFTPDDIALWDEWSAAWTVIHSNLQAALESTGIVDETNATNSRSAKAAALSAFESTKLRFFGHLLQTIQSPALIHAIEDDIANGLAPVVQVTSTNQSVLERRLKHAGEMGIENIDITPKEYVIDYLENAFPVVKQQPIYEDGEIVDTTPLLDEDGNHVVCPEADAAREALLNRLILLPECLGALDQLVLHFGPDRLAECTGRSRRLVMANGSRTLVTRPASSNPAEAARFMAGDADLLVFSDAGGTGRSYHASLDHKNQKRRSHYLIEPGWRASKAIQGLGRSHRSNQAVPPRFRPVSTNLAGQKRFISTIARRLEVLGAFTKADRRSAGDQLFSALDNLEGPYAFGAYRNWVHQLASGKACISAAKFEELTGLKLTANAAAISDLPAITRWLNRLLALPFATQNAIFAEFFGLLEASLEQAKSQGILDHEISMITADEIRLLERHQLPADPEGFLPGYVSVYETTDILHPRSLDALSIDPDFISGYFKDRKTHTPILASMPRLAAGDNGIPYTVLTLDSPSSRWHQSENALIMRYEEIDQEEFTRLWKAAQSKPAQILKRLVHILHGASLHLWRSFDSSDISVRRVMDDNGDSVVGRLLTANQAKMLADIETRQKPDHLISQLREGRSISHTASRLHLVPTRFMDKPVIEIRGWKADDLPFWTSLGAQAQRHAYQMRLTVPDQEALVFLQRLQQSRPDLVLAA